MAQGDPKCPYCGTEMIDDSYTWQCPACHSSSPVVIYEEKCQTMTEEEKKDYAREAAFRRPLQKPLTLDELKALCETGSHCIYIEHYHANPDIENPITPNVGIKSGRGYRITHCNGYRYKFVWTDYGKTWRAWISMPTDEERRAAPWEV